MLHDAGGAGDAQLVRRPHSGLRSASAAERLSTAQQFINKQIIDAARRTRSRRASLKGGDPMLFGRADEKCVRSRPRASSAKWCPASRLRSPSAASL